MSPTRTTGGPYPEGEGWEDYHCTECGGSTYGGTSLNECSCPPEEDEDLAEQRSLLTAEFDDAEAALARDQAEERAWEWEARETSDNER